MKLDVGNFTIEHNVENSARCWVHREYLGYILSFDFATYKAYLVEFSYKHESRIWREILLPPDDFNEHDKFWLEEYLVNKQNDGYNILGIQELKDISLPEYKVSAEYSEFVERHNKMWESIRNDNS